MNKRFFWNVNLSNWFVTSDGQKKVLFIGFVIFNCGFGIVYRVHK